MNAPRAQDEVCDQDWLQVHNILVMRPDNIGDVVMTGPSLRAIKKKIPEARLTMLLSKAGARAAPLLPGVDDVIVARTLWQDLGNLPFDPGRERALIDRLQRHAFDAAIILTSFSQSPYPAAWISLLAGIPLRLGASKEKESADILTHAMPPAPDALHQVQRNLALLEALGIVADDRRLAVEIKPEARNAARELRQARGLDAAQPYILLCPWASCPARTYPADRFAAAARGLAEKTGLPVLVTGAARERQRREGIVQRIGALGIDLVGQTTVPQLAALVDEATVVLANNSLPIHLADACRTPVVVLYSGTELESQWKPRHTAHRLLRRPTSCSPCYRFTCPYNLECLDLHPVEVANAALQLLEASKNGHLTLSASRPQRA